MLLITVPALLAMACLCLLLARRTLGQRLVERVECLSSRFAKAAEQLPPDVDPSTPLSLRAQCRYLQWTLPRQRDSWKVWFFRTARSEVALLERELEDLEAGRDPLRGATGVALRGLRSPVDGGETVYSLRVPESYGGSKPWPLIVHLHGRGKLEPFQGHRAPDYGEAALVLAPYGKGSVDFMGPAEADVLASIEEVCRLYSVDRDRVYLAGASMGGTGAWHLAAHYPDRFAALVAASANADDRVWEELWEGPAPRRDAGSASAALARAERLDSPVTYAANLLNVSCRVIHGADDAIVPVGHARSMVAALEAAGARVEFRELVGVGHNVSYGRTRGKHAEWLLAHRRESRPARVRFATDGRWSGAYWVRRVDPDSPLALAEVDARVSAEGGVEVSTTGCLALELDLARLPGRTGGGVRVSIDGQALGEFAAGLAAFRREGGAWRRAEAMPPRAPREVYRIFDGPFAVVYGTGAEDAALGEALRRQAERIASEWRRRYFTSPRVHSDVEVPEDVLGGCGLILLGGPDENAVARRALALLRESGREPPLVIAGGKVRCGGEELADGDPETLGAQFCWPSPFGPGRSIAVVWGASWRSLTDLNNRFGNSFDWTVYENRRWFGYGVFDVKTGGPESFLRVGLYSPDWGLDPRFSWSRPAGGWRDMPGRSPVRRRVSEVPEGQVLHLDELLPAEIHQLRGPVGFGRGW
ncbi:MAG: carboxylesterase family protein, partial [Planctomycetota bacterium]